MSHKLLAGMKVTKNSNIFTEISTESCSLSQQFFCT